MELPSSSPIFPGQSTDGLVRAVLPFRYRVFDFFHFFPLFSSFKDSIYLFLEGREGEREGEKHQCVVASHTPPTGDLAGHPGMCPDWESNQ